MASITSSSFPVFSRLAILAAVLVDASWYDKHRPSPKQVVPSWSHTTVPTPTLHGMVQAFEKMDTWLEDQSSEGGITQAQLPVLRKFGHAVLTIRFNLLKQRARSDIGSMLAPPQLLLALGLLGENLSSDAFVNSLTMSEFNQLALRVRHIIPMVQQAAQVMRDLEDERAAPPCQFIALNTSGIETMLTLRQKKHLGYGVWESVSFGLFLFCDPKQGTWLIGHSLVPHEAVLFMPWSAKHPATDRVPTQKRWQRLDQAALGGGYQNVNLQCVFYPYQICDCFHISSESASGIHNVDGYYALTKFRHGGRPVWRKHSSANQTILYAQEQQGMKNATAPVNWLFGMNLIPADVSVICGQRVVHLLFSWLVAPCYRRYCRVQVVRSTPILLSCGLRWCTSTK
jgi:hypothetical protein